MRKARGKQIVHVLGLQDELDMQQASDWLPKSEVDVLRQKLIARGARQGRAEELIGTPWTLINGNGDSEETLERQLARYIAVLCLGLLVPGRVSLYVTGLLGCKTKDTDEGMSLKLLELYGHMEYPASHTGQVMRLVQAILHLHDKLLYIDNEGSPFVLPFDDVAVLAVVLEEKGGPGVGKSPLLVVCNIAPEPRSTRLKNLPLALAGCNLTDSLENLGRLGVQLGNDINKPPPEKDVKAAVAGCGLKDIGCPAAASGVLCRPRREVQCPEAPRDDFDEPVLTLELGPYEVLWLSAKRC